QLAPVAAVQLRAAFAGRGDEADGEALVIGHSHQRGFAVARQSFDADLFCVLLLVCFEIIQRAARAPGPSAQSSPIVGLTRPALVAEADDAARQPRAVVGLNA